jgi:type III pantothenate kinase
MYDLFLDIGNTSIAIALYEGQTLQQTGRMPSDATLSQDTYENHITDFLAPYNITLKDINELVIASVVPTLTATLTAIWQTQHNNEPFIIDAHLKTNLKIELPDPNELGSDILAGAVAAHAAYPHTTKFIVDMGTATTIMIITPDGRFRGGSIVTGMELMLSALIDNTALLSVTANIGHADITAIGTTTATAIESGIVYGYTGLIDNIIANMLLELDTTDYKIIATGGQAPLIGGRSKYLDTYNPNLIFEGMQIIYEHNKHTY